MTSVSIVSAEAVRDVLEGTAARYIAETGNVPAFAFMTAGQVRARVEAGEPIDLAIASSGVIAELVESGRARPGAGLGRIGLAVAVREGAPAIDTSTPDALVGTLLAARAVSYTNPAAGGTAGLYFVGLMQRLGIAEQINRRAVLSNGGRDAAEKVASGVADLGITFPSEINPVIGARVGGMFPQELQNYVTYSAAFPVAAGNPAAAQDYLAMLRGSPARPLWQSAGFEPLAAQV